MGAEVLESLTPAQQVIKIVNEELTALMGGTEARLAFEQGPTVVMMCGLQGAGKTTHAAKLAYISASRAAAPAGGLRRLPSRRHRPAAGGGQAGRCPVFTLGAKPRSIARKALAHAQDHGNDMVILDTAGRLQIDEALMEELEDIKAAVKPGTRPAGRRRHDRSGRRQRRQDLRRAPGRRRRHPHQARRRHPRRRGAFRPAVTGKPIKFVGTGEKLDDLEPFHPDRMAQPHPGHGRCAHLIEKAPGGR